MKSRPVKRGEGAWLPCEIHEATHLQFRMPGPCGEMTLPVMIGGTREGTGNWTWNGSVDAPTLKPSIATTYVNGEGVQQKCHSWINDGIVKFLDDCTHSLKGQELPLLDL